MAPTLSLAFVAGLFSFLSPCVLPLVPSYIAYVGGSANPSNRAILIRNSLFFILGFSLIFIALGASASLLGAILHDNRQILMVVGGIIIILFGLVMVGVIRHPMLDRDTRQQYTGKASTPWGASLLGMAFAAGWTPCIGPMLGAILTMASMSNTLGEGVLLLSVYALGLGVPFFIAALAITPLLAFNKKIGKYLPLIEKIAGVILIIAGVLMLTGLYTQLNAFLIKITPDWIISRI